MSRRGWSLTLLHNLRFRLCFDFGGLFRCFLFGLSLRLGLQFCLDRCGGCRGRHIQTNRWISSSQCFTSVSRKKSEIIFGRGCVIIEGCGVTGAATPFPSFGTIVAEGFFNAEILEGAGRNVDVSDRGTAQESIVPSWTCDAPCEWGNVGILRESESGSECGGARELARPLC